MDLDRQTKARVLVAQYYNERVEKTDNISPLRIDHVYVVWFTKTLQNWKALVSTTVPDGMYFEVTYDGDGKQTFLDAYKKFDNVRFPDSMMVTEE